MQKKTPLLEYGVLGAVVIVGGAWLLRSSSSKPSGPPPKPGYSESFLQAVVGQQAQLDAAALQERAQLAQAHYSYAAVANADAAQTRQVQIQGATAIHLGTIAEDTQNAENLANEKIAQIFGTTQQQIASQQAQAQEQSSSNSMWGGIFGGLLSGLGALFGFSSAPADIYDPQGPPATSFPMQTPPVYSPPGGWGFAWP